MGIDEKRTATPAPGDSLSDVWRDCFPDGKTVSKAGLAMRERSHGHQVGSINPCALRLPQLNEAIDLF
jgi:hypothetical protein